MEPTVTPSRREAIDHELTVHNWRVAQLGRLGIPGPLVRSTATTSTGIRSPGWCSAAAPRDSPCASSADAPGELA